MKKRAISLAILLISSLVIFASFASAAYSWSVVTKANCLSEPNSTVVMGLSATTNAMAQDYTYASGSSAYTYVLCLQNFGNDHSCSTSWTVSPSIPKNTIVGLSSETNAHTETPYTTSPVYTSYHACFGSLSCISSTSGCNPSTYPINLFNLTANTNSHVSSESTSGYNIAICCKDTTLNAGSLACQLTDAKWAYNPIIAHGQAGLNVAGTYCDSGTPIEYDIQDSSSGNTVKTIYGYYPNATWYDVLPAGSYTFTATAYTVPNNVPKNSGTLTVKPSSESNCNNPPTCSDYTSLGSTLCQSDSCQAATNPSNPEFNNATGQLVSASCIWQDNQCKWAGNFGTDISNPPRYCDGTSCSDFAGCNSGYTYCVNASSGDLKAYCWPGFNCPTGDTPQSSTCTRLYAGCSTSACSSQFSYISYYQSDVNDTCYPGASCLFQSNSLGGGGMCNGTVSGSVTYCSNGACYNNPVTTAGCSGGYTSCVYNGFSACYPGSTCPEGSTPLGNANITCDSTTSCAAPACLNDPTQPGPKGNCGGDAYCKVGSCYSSTNYIGRCVLTISHSGDCSSGGFIDLNVTANWTGDPTSIPPDCKDTIRRVECPAQIPLPFFNTYNLIATAAVLVLIYVAVIILRKKPRRAASKKRTKRTRKTKRKKR